MNKLPYKKPEIALIELNKEIIMASGACVDDSPCEDNDCGSVCDPDAPTCHLN